MITVVLEKDILLETLIALRDREHSLMSEESANPTVRAITQRQLERVRESIRALSNAAEH